MKYITLLLFLLLTLSNSFAQSKPQSIQKLDVEQLRLPKTPIDSVLVLDENHKATNSNVLRFELEALQGINTSTTIQNQLNLLDSTLVNVNDRTSNIDNTRDTDKPISNAAQLALDSKANDSSVVHKTGTETITGAKTFTGEVNLNGLSQPCWNRTESEMQAITPTTSKCVYNTDKKSPFFFDVSSGKWRAAGGGSGQGGINYITNYSFEDDLSGWGTYNDGPSDTPVDGIGGTSSLSLFRDTSMPLFGAGSLRVLTTSGVSPQGNGIYTDITIDRAARNSRVPVIIPNIFPAIIGDNAIKVFIYDKTNLSVIEVERGTFKYKAGGGIVYGYFNATSSVDYRVMVHILSTTTTAFAFYIDNTKVAPESEVVNYLNLDNQGDPKDYGAMTVTAVTTNPTKATTREIDSVKCRQNGPDWECNFNYSAASAAGGAAGSGDYLFQLPVGVDFSDSIPMYSGTTRLDYAAGATNSKILSMGAVSYNNSSGGPIQGATRYDARRFRVSFEVPFTTAANISSSQFNFALGSLSYNFYLKFPGKGLAPSISSAVGKSDYTDLKNHDEFDFLVAAGGTVTQDLPFITSPCSASAGVLTCAVVGLTSKPNCTASVTSAGLYDLSYIEGSSTSTSLRFEIRGTSGMSSQPVSINCRKTSQDRADAFKSVSLATNRSSNMLTDTTGIKAVATSHGTIPNLAATTVIFNSVTWDYDSSYNSSTGITTIKRTGKYTICGSLGAPVGGYSGPRAELYIYKNGSQLSQLDKNSHAIDAAVGVLLHSCEDVMLNATDTIDIRFLHQFGAAAAPILTDNKTWFSLKYIGQ